MKPANEETITAREAIAIATSYGLPYRQFKGEILDNIIQARSHHLMPRRDGRSKSARDYFDGYMADIAHEARADEACAARS